VIDGGWIERGDADDDGMGYTVAAAHLLIGIPGGYLPLLFPYLRFPSSIYTGRAFLISFFLSRADKDGDECNEVWNGPLMPFAGFDSLLSCVTIDEVDGLSDRAAPEDECPFI
jgi:hypothetical protein